MDLTGRVALLSAQRTAKKDERLPVAQAAGLLEVNRTSAYYVPKEPSELEIQAKHRIDRIHTDFPTWGSRQISKTLKREGINIGRYKTRRYMNEMSITVIYPKPNLSKPSKEHKVYPYLLKNFVATRSNQAWSIDITYIRLRHGFIYLTAIIDWFSKCIVGWEVDDTLNTHGVIAALKKAYAIATPEIINSDQGSQFTSKEYIDFVTSQKSKISMDGKGRWADNITIERWFRTLKYDEVYLNEYANIKEARTRIGKFIHSYNFVKLHSAIGYVPPAEVYYPALLSA